MFAAVMVIIVAALLSFAATTLKPYQDKNIEEEKKQNILSSIDVNVSREESTEAYSEYIKKELVINNNELNEGADAFTIDLSKEIKKAPTERNAPLYIAEKDGSTFFIIPLRGKGLWGPIWGYVSLKSDINTIQGAVFDHEGETPGLGAEITTAKFNRQFKEKKILDENGGFVSIDVRKGDAHGDYQVDGISGGTITSTGVEAMLYDCIQAYVPFLKKYTAEQDSVSGE